MCLLDIMASIINSLNRLYVLDIGGECMICPLMIYIVFHCNFTQQILSISCKSAPAVVTVHWIDYH